MTSDLALLQDYARNNVQGSFNALVKRHLDLVYTAALRQVRSPQLAEEVAQSVFADLARNARKLKPDTILTAWLYQVARRTAIDVVRRESRRQLREQVASEMNAMNATADDWTYVEPLLDDAMEALDDTDRTAILLRYFESKSLREVGQQLGVSDDTAQKRVSRAVNRLREFFAKREVKIGGSSFVTLISTNAVQAAPAALASTISATTAVLSTTLATSTAATATKAITMTTLQKTVITATLAVVAGGGIYEARQASQLQEEVQLLQQQQAPIEEQRDGIALQLTSLREENEQLKTRTTELLRLRNEVTTLRRSLKDAESRLAVASSQLAVSPSNDSIDWRPEWADAGVASPGATIRTYIHALVSSDVERLRQTMVFDLQTNSVPVSSAYAERELRSDADKWVVASLGGVRFHRGYPGFGDNLNRALFEVEITNPIIESGRAIPVDPAHPPVWNPEFRESFQLLNIRGEWKILRDPDRLRLTIYDDDSETVARMMLQMDPENLEQLRSDPRLPAKTLKAYEALKIQGTK